MAAAEATPRVCRRRVPPEARHALAGLSGREKHQLCPNSASVGSLELQTYLINSILPNREIPVS